MYEEIIGQRFGRLLVIGVLPDIVQKNGRKRKNYLCQCDCGIIVEAQRDHLLGGREKSCGCLRSEMAKRQTHGDIHSRLYRAWGNMCNRCSNPNNPAWNRYGKRGITVCEEWHDYSAFREWAYHNGYSDELQLDRIDNNAGYNPQNCRWADRFVQANNKRNNHIIEFQGKTKTLSEWAKVLGIPYKSLHHRVVSLGWGIERAFTQPLRKHPLRNLSNTQDG